MSYKNEAHVEEQDLLTIIVETLTETTFEVKVSPQDTVKSIKSNIQRVEGIPISHQRLLYKSKELQDSSCITEPSVSLYDGAKIKLVLSMKGGPISLVHQAVPFNRTLLKNLIKYNREELEELPAGCKMAILVLRVGDQLNLLHVVKELDDLNDNDTIPDSKSDLFSDLLEAETSKYSEENSITMEKMTDLKERLGHLSVQQKSLKDGVKIEDNAKQATDILQQNQPSSSLKLPSISHQVQGEIIKSRSEFSQVPILPSIVPQSRSRELEFVSFDEESISGQLCEAIRPKTCPSSLAESHFYNVFSEDKFQDTFTLPHFRSCVSACASKLQHELGGRKTLLRNLNVFSSSSDVVPEILKNSHSNNKIKIEPKMTQKTSVIKIENSNIYCGSKQNRRDSSFNVNRNRSAAYTASNEEKTQTDISNDHKRFEVKLLPPFSSKVFPDVGSDSISLNNSENTSLCDILNSKIQNNLAEPVHSKKNNRLRCSECNKRLSLSSTFECRCGFVFCSYHRYSEAHHCTYDFKKGSRKLLERANPLVVAPKLPKI